MLVNSQKLIGRCRIPVLLVLIFVLQHAAAGEEFLLWKAYAGTISYSSKTYEDDYSKPASNLPNTILREIERNRQENVVIPDLSVIKCQSNRNFGIVYYVIFDEARTASFELTWYFPHLEKEKGNTSRSTKITARMAGVNPNRRWLLYKAFWDLEKEDLKDGDFALILHRDDDVLVHHVFQIRGCESSETT